MDKNKCIEELNKLEYKAQIMDGIIIIYLNCDSDKEASKEMDKIKKMLEQKGYVGSIGFRWKQLMDDDQEEFVPEKIEYKKPEPIDFDLEEENEGQMSFMFD